MHAHENITLRPEDFNAFLATLDAQTEPNAALKNAFKRHSEQVAP